MAENTNQTPSTTTGYTVEGRELEQESLAGTYPIGTPAPAPLPDDEAAGAALQAATLAGGEPARVNDEVETAAAGDSSEMLGEVLQSQELNPAEPAVTNDPVPLEGAAPAAAACTPGYVAQGRALEQESLAGTYPVAPNAAAPAPYYAAPAASQGQAAAPVAPAAHQAAYQAAYGAPAVGAAAQAPTAPAQCAYQPGPGAAPAYNPQAAAAAAAYKKPRTPLNPEHVFLICGMVVGAVVIVFGLCMLAFYTPADVTQLFDGFHSGGSQAITGAGATAAQVCKAGFAMLLIGLGATDICAFGAKLMHVRNRCHRNQK